MIYFKLNNKDLWAVFGVKIQRDGLDAFLQLPKRKESLSSNYPEKNGLDIDLSEPAFEARDFRLKCLLRAKGYTSTEARDNFWNLYNGLFTELSLPGDLTFWIKDFNKTFNLYYKGQENIGKLTKITQKEVYITFDLIFAEADPTDNIPPVFLVDDQDRFLII